MITKHAILVIIALTIIDIIYTGYGAFYGGGGAELNPLFNWTRDPAVFMSTIIVSKIICIGSIIWLINWARAKDPMLGNRLGYFTNVTYGMMLIAILGINVYYQLFVAGG